MEDMGAAEFTEEESRPTSRLLMKGGFLWVDDFWGHAEWNTGSSRFRVSAAEGISDLRSEARSPLFHTQYPVKGVPQIPSIRVWRPGGSTSEYGEDSIEVHGRGNHDKAGRLMVFMTHNTDIDDAWEREGEDPRYFLEFGPTVMRSA
jgi:hypothetical protein